MIKNLYYLVEFQAGLFDYDWTVVDMKGLHYVLEQYTLEVDNCFEKKKRIQKTI